MQSRLFIVRLAPYTYEQFYNITVLLLTSNHYNVDEEIAKATAEAVWNSSKNIRDSIKIGLKRLIKILLEGWIPNII